MEPDRNGQDPEKPEKKEIPSTNSTRSLKRKEDQQQEDPPGGPKKKIYNYRKGRCHLIKQCVIKVINSPNKTGSFKNIMKYSNIKEGLCIDATSANRLMHLFSEDVFKDRGGENQYGFSVLSTDGEHVKSPDVCPDHLEKKHSEEILIEEINKFLQTTRLKVKTILIYTLNSPCLIRRKKHIQPCMFQLLESALQWEHEYGICTVVGFTKLWPSVSPEYFKYLTFSDISCADNCFYPYFETCERIPFQLNLKGFREDVKNSGIYGMIKYVGKKDREKLRELIQSALGELIDTCENSSGLRKEHLDRGMKKINSFSSRLIPFFNNVSEDDKDKVSQASKHLIDSWKKIVESSFMSSIREKITADFNSALFNFFVKILQSSLWYSSPLQLYEILE